MRQHGKSYAEAANYRCNHPPAVVVDPTARELRELEQMLARCPICRQWSPGDGPIMAIVSTEETTCGDDLA